MGLLKKNILNWKENIQTRMTKSIKSKEYKQKCIMIYRIVKRLQNKVRYKADAHREVFLIPLKLI